MMNGGVGAAYKDFQNKLESSSSAGGRATGTVTGLSLEVFISSTERYSNWLKLSVEAYRRFSTVRRSSPCRSAYTRLPSWNGRCGMITVVGREIATISGSSRARR